MFSLETSSVATASANTPSYLKSDSYFCYFCFDTTIDGNSFRNDHSGKVRTGMLNGICESNIWRKRICFICAFIFSEAMVDCGVTPGQMIKTAVRWYKVCKNGYCVAASVVLSIAYFAIQTATGSIFIVLTTNAVFSVVSTTVFCCCFICSFCCFCFCGFCCHCFVCCFSCCFLYCLSCCCL